MAALLRSTKSLIAVALVGAACAGFAGCGVKGPLEPPPGAKAAGDAKSAESADPGKNSDAPPKPHESLPSRPASAVSAALTVVLTLPAFSGDAGAFHPLEALPCITFSTSPASSMRRT